MKPIVHSNFGYTLDSDFSVPVEIWIDRFDANRKVNPETIQVFIAMEPDEVSGVSRILKSGQFHYDHALTFDEDILNSVPNARLFEFGTKWVEIEKYEFPEKKFCISTVCGHKAMTAGHRMRQKLWYKQLKINKPTDFYLSKHLGVENINNNKILGESKFPMFDSMFHVCIENVSKKYYFSEKLIDCLLCKTIPIYCGCTNIGDYFNTDGFIIVKNADDIVEVCNTLTEEDYKNRRDIIEENAVKAMGWIDYSGRLTDKLKSLGL
jgi:hypothetical protein